MPLHSKQTKLEEIHIYFWLGISVSIPIEAEDGLSHLFGGNYRQLGLSICLLMTVIKYCAVNNKDGIDLYLKVSLGDHIACYFHTKNGFYNKDNKSVNVPISLHVLKVFLYQKNIFY